MKKDTVSANARSPESVVSSPVNSPEELQVILENVATNPAKVDFPRDVWGFTSNLKKEALRAASSINGQRDKHDLFMATLAVIAKHVEARFEVDNNFNKDLAEQRIVSENERLTRQRVFGVSRPGLVNPLEQKANLNG